ncbi:MAG: type II secretion system F family protein [Methylohalobius crimeensis]
MDSPILWSYLIAALLIAAALWLYRQSQRKNLEEKVDRRLAEWNPAERQTAPRRGRTPFPTFKPLFWRAGIEIREGHLQTGFMGLVALCVGGGWAQGAWLALTAPLIAVLACYLWLEFRARKRISLILVQLPLFLDQVLRGLGTGRSMDGALSLAAMETPAPLKEVIERVLRTNRLGADLGIAIQESAELYRIDELHLLALAVKINRRYGSSARELLQNVIRMIRQRETTQRELRALTGETRISAWVLGSLPPGMAAYMMAMNPRYLSGMWQDPSGRILLLVAVSLQIIGAIILWRMVKSV